MHTYVRLVWTPTHTHARVRRPAGVNMYFDTRCRSNKFTNILSACWSIFTSCCLIRARDSCKVGAWIEDSYFYAFLRVLIIILFLSLNKISKSRVDVMSITPVTAPKFDEAVKSFFVSSHKYLCNIEYNKLYFIIDATWFYTEGNQ